MGGEKVTAIIILLAIVALLILLLLIRVRIHLEGGEAFSAVLSILWLRIPLYPRPPKPPRRAEGKGEEKQKEEPEEKKSLSIRALPSVLHDVAGVLKQLAQILISKLFKKIVVEKLTVKLAVSTGDAADTALLYPKITAGAYSVFSLVYGLVTVKKYDVNIFPDFTHQKSRWYGELDLYLRVMHILALGLAILILFFKNRRRIRSAVETLQTDA